MNHRLNASNPLTRPERIEVTAPVPDYPPILFRYKNEVHYIKKADGPERIEQEWWIETGEHQDYYQVEDEQVAVTGYSVPAFMMRIAQNGICMDFSYECLMVE